MALANGHGLYMAVTTERKAATCSRYKFMLRRYNLL
jgi:hypothetical protein